MFEREFDAILGYHNTVVRALSKHSHVRTGDLFHMRALVSGSITTHNTQVRVYDYLDIS